MSIPKRTARKIASLIEARSIHLNQTPPGLEHSGKIEGERAWLAKSIARRYGVAVEDIPPDAIAIEQAVLNGHL